MARPRNYLTLKDGITGSELGRLVAEQDQELTDYYVNPARYVDRALNANDPAIYFVGPKGVGKSAILQMVRLTRAADSNRIINIAPTDLAFSALANIDAVTPLLEDVHRHQWLFRSLWDYVLALEIITRELPSENQVVAWVKSLFREKHENEARKLLKISIGDDGRLRESWSMRFLTILKEIELSGKSVGIDVTGKAKLDWDALSRDGQLNKSSSPA